MKLDQNQARFLIAAKSFLHRELMKNPELKIYDCEVPKGKITSISRLSEAEAEEVARGLNNSGLIHMQIAGGVFDCCKVASLSFDILDKYLADKCKINN